MSKYFLVLKEGSTGDAVILLQESLKELGFYFGFINGVFDQNTKAAVIKFQKNNSIAADGIVGIATRAALVRYFWN
ncbi:MAG: peptidoglycan-binding domain-containing protein [Rivularia sp. (in: cyanobacteria)]